MTFVTKADADARLAAQQTDTDRGTWVDPSLGKETFGEYARKWLGTRSDLAETTRDCCACTSCLASATAGSPRSTPRRCPTGPLAWSLGVSSRSKRWTCLDSCCVGGVERASGETQSHHHRGWHTMSEPATGPSGFVPPWWEQPPLSGHVYRITDPLSFFGPIIGGQGPPQAGYEPWAGLEVRTWAVNDLLPIPIPGPTAETEADGSFGITQPPNASVLGDMPRDVRFALLVTEGSFPFRPLYRSDLSLSVAAAETTELNIWLLTETVDVKDGISAGDVSGAVNGSGLPGNTEITASPSGLAFSGSHLGADVRFGIALTPDTTFDLTTFLDLQLSSWNIHVGWPADWCTNADDILAEIVGGLQAASASMNSTVLTRIKAGIVETAPLLAGEIDAVPRLRCLGHVHGPHLPHPVHLADVAHQGRDRGDHRGPVHRLPAPPFPGPLAAPRDRAGPADPGVTSGHAVDRITNTAGCGFERLRGLCLTFRGLGGDVPVRL